MRVSIKISPYDRGRAFRGGRPPDLSGENKMVAPARIFRLIPPVIPWKITPFLAHWLAY